MMLWATGCGNSKRRRVFHAAMHPVKSLSFLFLSLFLPAVASPVVINAAKLMAAFEKGVGGFTEDDELPTADELAEAVKEAPGAVKQAVSPVEISAEDPVEAVYMIGGVYKCVKCDRWHPGGLATAWALSSDGVMVTNYHVFEKAKGGAMGVCGRDGKTYPVMEILAADQAADMALFRVKAEGLPALAMGEPAAVGSRVQVISHPNRRFFMQTFGDVARYHLRPGRRDRGSSTWMSITADYAKGSSGGPVLNPERKVVGMVASTQSIYYESDNGQPKGALQMVVKNCVPVSAIATMLGETKD